MLSQACLIVAHDPWFIQLLRIYSEEIGLRVLQAYDGQDVLPVVHRESPVVILMEEDLPGKIKTLDLLRALREDPVSKALPVLVFSWRNQVYRQDYLPYAATFLEAPITFEVLVAAVREAGVQVAVEKHSAECPDQTRDSGDVPDPLSHEDEVA